MTFKPLSEIAQEVIGGLQVTAELDDPFKLPFGCPKCDGYGNVIDDTGARFCECKINYFAGRRLQQANLPFEAKRISLATFKPVNAQSVMALSLCQNWLKSFPDTRKPGLLFWGFPGTGKTHLAVGVAKELLARGSEIRWIDYQEIFRELKKSFNSKEPFSLEEYCYDSPILFIDDLGVGRVTDFTADEICSMVRYRYTKRMPTIITTNLDFNAGELAEKFGVAVESRLVDLCTAIFCGSEDYRRQEREIAS